MELIGYVDLTILPMIAMGQIAPMRSHAKGHV